MNGKLLLQKSAASILCISGVALLIYMIIVEDEPSPIPLVMIIIGISWFVLASKKSTKKS